MEIAKEEDFRENLWIFLQRGNLIWGHEKQEESGGDIRRVRGGRDSWNWDAFAEQCENVLRWKTSWNLRE